MSKSKKKQENNDFWNDCLKETIIYNNPKKDYNKNQKLKNISISTNNSFMNKRKKNKRLYRYNTKPTFLQSEILKQDLILEENNKPENNKKIIQSIEHMISLYKKGMALKETQKKNIAQNSEKTLKLEKETCSFKPKLYRNKSLQKKVKKDFGNSTIYERGMKFQQKKRKKFQNYLKKIIKKIIKFTLFTQM